MCWWTGFQFRIVVFSWLLPLHYNVESGKYREGLSNPSILNMHLKNDFWYGKFMTTSGIGPVVTTSQFAEEINCNNCCPPKHNFVLGYCRTSIYTDGFYHKTSMALTNFLELKSRSSMQNSLLYYLHNSQKFPYIPKKWRS